MGVCVCVPGKALADNINVLVTYPVLLPQLLSVSVCLFALARLTCDFLSLTICKQASVCVCVSVCTLPHVCVCVWHNLAFWFVKSNVQSKWSVIRIRTAFPHCDCHLVRPSLSLSLSLTVCLFVWLSVCQSFCQSVSWILCVCVCVCEARKLIILLNAFV